MTALELAREVVSACLAAGVREFVYCPGSRNAPLAYALAERERAGQCRVHVRLDERAAGFLALGLARGAAYATQRPAGAGEKNDAGGQEMAPVAIAVTSGTAVAELYPAVLEAYHAGVPLVVLSADRPRSMWGTGASQTTWQHLIYGRFVRASLTIGEQRPLDSRLKMQLAAVVEAARAEARAAGEQGCEFGSAAAAQSECDEIVWGAEARQARRGPVHLNLCFAPPLCPAGGAAPDEAEKIPAAPRPDSEGARGGCPAAACRAQGDAEQESRVAALSQLLGAARRPVLVAGDQADEHVVAAALAAGWPVLPEPTAPLPARRAPGMVVPHVSLVLPTLQNQIDLVLTTGHPTLHRPFAQLLSRSDVTQITADSNFPPLRLSPNCAGFAAAIIASALQKQAAAGEEARLIEWREQWKRASKSAARKVEAYLRRYGGAGESAALSGDAKASIFPPEEANPKSPAFDPLWLLRELDSCNYNSASAPLAFLGASNGIRALELASEYPPSRPIYLSNRGLAGIDGTLSTALGVALASARPVRVVVGDLTCLHDLTGLLRPLGAESLSKVNMQVIVLNDEGGQIFRTLEYGAADRSEFFSKYFLTGQNANFASLARALGWEYEFAATSERFRSLVRSVPRGLTLVEVPTKVDDLRARRKMLRDE